MANAVVLFILWALPRVEGWIDNVRASSRPPKAGEVSRGAGLHLGCRGLPQAARAAGREPHRAPSDQGLSGLAQGCRAPEASDIPAPAVRWENGFRGVGFTCHAATSGNAGRQRTHPGGSDASALAAPTKPDCKLQERSRPTMGKGARRMGSGLLDLASCIRSRHGIALPG